MRRLIFVALVVLLVSVLAHAVPQSRERADLLLLGGTVITMDARRTVIEDGAIAVRGDSIVAVGQRAAIEAQYSAGRRLDTRGKILLPGLINTHTHAPMTLMRGIADDRALQDWLENYIFPAEARNVTAEYVAAGTRLAALEMIRGGTTTYTDMYYFEDVIARETKAAGLRGVLGETIIDFPAPDNKTPAAALDYTESFLKKWRGDPLVRAAVAPHSLYTDSERTLREAASLARQYKAPILIHVSETKRELDESRAKHGLSPVAYLDRIGVLGPDVLAAHCVWVDASDIAILMKRDVGCAHNPSSNMMLASGLAPVTEMIAAGLRLGLGTDGPAGSNNDLNMFEEMDLAAKLQKAMRSDPRALSAGQALELATIGGARALHMEKEIGSLEIGKRADIVVLNPNTPNATPVYDVFSQIVYSTKAADVETVIVNGRILMQNRRVLTLDEAKVLEEARMWADRVKKSLVSSR